MSAGRTAEERYLGATQSGNLQLKAGAQCDADLLLAAAYSARMGSDRDRRTLALDVYRLRATGDMGGAHQVAERLGEMIGSRSRPRRGASHLRDGAPTIRRIEAKDLAMTVLKWWQMPTCPECDGRGHPLLGGDIAMLAYGARRVLDESRVCPTCHGSGVRPLERLVRAEHAHHATWLASEIESLCGVVFNDMSRLLRNTLEI